MITWIQNIIQKHYKWLFSLLLILVIVAFVFTGVPMSQQSSRRQGDQIFYGINFTNPEDVEFIMRGVQISERMGDAFPMFGNRDRLYFERALMLHLADELQIPAPTDEALISYIQSRRGFTDNQGNFSPSDLTEFLDLLKLNNISEDVFYEVAKDNYRITQAQETLYGIGYVTTEEAILEVQSNGTKWSIDVGSLNYDDFKFEMEPDEEALKGYYERNTNRYESAERIQVSFVHFPSEPFVKDVPTPTEDEIKQYFERNLSKFGEKKLEEAKDEVIHSLKLEKALPLVEKHVYTNFAEPLFHQKIAKDSDEFTALVNKLGVKKESLQPYTKTGSLFHPFISRKILSKAFDMTREFSDPYKVENGIVVLIKEGSIPATTKPFDEVKTQVKAQLIEDKRREAFTAKGKEISEKLNKSKSENDKFVMSEASELGIEVQPYRDFTMQEPPSDLPPAIISQLKELKEGKISDMLMQGNKGYFISILKKDVPEAKASDEIVKTNIVELQNWTQRRASYNIVDELIAEGRKTMNPNPTEEEAVN